MEKTEKKNGTILRNVSVIIGIVVLVGTIVFNTAVSYSNLLASQEYTKATLVQIIDDNTKNIIRAELAIKNTSEQTALNEKAIISTQKDIEYIKINIDKILDKLE